MNCLRLSVRDGEFIQPAAQSREECAASLSALSFFVVVAYDTLMDGRQKRIAECVPTRNNTTDINCYEKKK
ncbi:hypothetical protein OUZ56_003887 [Daphnia magna]|uniref:Uncharacterized protein n=1 Tax=Daphnia magna TaxID=35525 RepID=A0ABQ9YN35_9CRUS|nr:hypothetical protein OUZ56_003887 [Daphnia magna]